MVAPGCTSHPPASLSALWDTCLQIRPVAALITAQWEAHFLPRPSHCLAPLPLPHAPHARREGRFLNL